MFATARKAAWVAGYSLHTRMARETERLSRSVDLHLAEKPKEANKMSVGTILLVILVLALAGVIPTWPHSREWGYGPSGGVGLILAIVLILFLLGKI